MSGDTSTTAGSSTGEHEVSEERSEDEGRIVTDGLAHVGAETQIERDHSEQEMGEIMDEKQDECKERSHYCAHCVIFEVYTSHHKDSLYEPFADQSKSSCQKDDKESTCEETIHDSTLGEHSTWTCLEELGQTKPGRQPRQAEGDEKLVSQELFNRLPAWTQ